MKRVTAARQPSANVIWAWHMLEGTEGQLSISSLAAQIGWSQKHLIAQFREQIGLPPKTVARILRFRSAVRRVESADQVRWAEIAHDCGYYDQAHFIREFRGFAGSTPNEFLGRLLPDGGGVIDL